LEKRFLGFAGRQIGGSQAGRESRPATLGMTVKGSF
jgi:hypothetical protein